MSNKSPTPVSVSEQPAYPINDADVYDDYNGLTKRELFAAMAMQGLATHFNKVSSSVEDIAVHSVHFADALLAELDKPINTGD